MRRLSGFGADEHASVENRPPGPVERLEAVLLRESERVQGGYGIGESVIHCASGSSGCTRARHQSYEGSITSEG